MTAALRLFRRDMAPAAKDASAPADSRVRRFVASTEAVDSYNTTIKASAWDLTRFQRNPIVPLMHNTYDFPIGKGVAWVDTAKKQLMIDVEFAPADDPVSGPDAEQALRWIDRGVLACSVGFNGVESEYNEARESDDPWENLFYPPLDYTRAELFEVSIVGLPANPDALPVGRALPTGQVLTRAAERIAAAELRKRSALETLTGEQLSTLIRTTTREEVEAHKARRAGNLRGV